MTTTSSTRPVLVAGGGIGGLAAALALARQGLAVKVLEPAPAIGEIGAQTTSQETYATVKLALEKEGTPYYGKASIFLQGSYGNDTNIFKESDVDVVIRLDSIFTYDISALPSPQREAFKASHPDATYTRREFQRHVLNVLNDRFKGDVELGNKAVFIEPRNNRREADVLIAVQHRKYN
jgi:2-polyprenyl-6-methoxyphenol hydroxylase-like FAD-dependent oxidoreductase